DPLTAVGTPLTRTVSKPSVELTMIDVSEDPAVVHQVRPPEYALYSLFRATWLMVCPALMPRFSTSARNLLASAIAEASMFVSIELAYWPIVTDHCSSVYVAADGSEPVTGVVTGASRPFRVNVLVSPRPPIHGSASAICGNRKFGTSASRNTRSSMP